MSLEEAAIDIRYLLDRGYPHKSAVGFVCSHYRLDDEARHLLSRGVLSKDVAMKRRAKFLPCDAIKGEKLVIDGYNIIIGMESILLKKAYVCDDGVIRDIRGVFRNFRVSALTHKAIELIMVFLKEKNPAYVCFLLDSQISKSGMFAGMLREKLRVYGINGDAKTGRHVDFNLKVSEDIIATSDGVVIDEAGKVVNFLNCKCDKVQGSVCGSNIKDRCWKLSRLPLIPCSLNLNSM